ncbi:hypothetical protein [Cryobacterium algoritolerans]|nr:hypothetical protein [Cryobacterium algoritolerans]
MPAGPGRPDLAARRARVSQRIGQLSSTQLVDLEPLVMAFLGLAD